MADKPGKPPISKEEWEKAQEDWDAGRQAAGAIPPLPQRNSAEGYEEALRILGDNAREGYLAASKSGALGNMERGFRQPLAPQGDKAGAQFRGGEKPTAAEPEPPKLPPAGRTVDLEAPSAEAEGYLRSGGLLPPEPSAQSERPSGHDILPKNWIEAVPAILFGFYGLAFAFEAVSAMNRGEIGVAIADTAGCILCAAVALAWWKRKDWLPQKLVATSIGIVTDARWLLGAMSMLLIASALAPYVEERRWPYGDWFKPAPIAAVPQSTTSDAAKLAAERDAAVKDRDAAVAELDSTKRALAAAQAASKTQPGSLGTEGGEIGAVSLLLRSGSNAEILSKTSNIKVATVEITQYDPSSPATMICTLSCFTVRIFFDGNYGPFDVSADDPQRNVLGIGTTYLQPPKASIERAATDSLDVMIEPGQPITFSDLRELRISITKRTY